MIIFLAGVHGVGKTFLGKPAAELLGFQYASASSLIQREFNGGQSWSNNKRTKNLDNNQEALVASVLRMIKTNNAKLILDGHFMLRNENGDLISISVDVFKRIGVSSVVLLEVPPFIVLERLAMRGVPQLVEEIIELIEAERKHAEYVCNEMNIPLEKLFLPTIEQLLDVLNNITL